MMIKANTGRLKSVGSVWDRGCIRGGYLRMCYYLSDLGPRKSGPRESGGANAWLASRILTGRV